MPLRAPVLLDDFISSYLCRLRGGDDIATTARK